MKHYTQNWNQEFINSTSGMGGFNLAMEIGCFEGLTSNYIIENLLSESGKLICVDPLQDTYLTGKLSKADKEINEKHGYFEGQYKRFLHNTEDYIKSGSLIYVSESLGERSIENMQFWDAIEGRVEFIYLDGDHREKAVKRDLNECLKLLAPGGIILIDDYNSEFTGIKKATDQFLKSHPEFSVIKEGYQLMIQKND